MGSEMCIRDRSQDHLRKRARFIWEIVEDQKRIRVSNRQAIDIRVRRLHLPYCLAADDTTSLTAGTKLMNLKKGITTAVRTVRTTRFGIEFSTERDLQERDGWLIFDETQSPLAWEPNLQATELQQVKINGEVHEIKHQQKASDDWQHLILEHSEPQRVKEEDKLEIDGLEFNAYDWELVPQGNAFGPTKDESVKSPTWFNSIKMFWWKGCLQENTSTTRTASNIPSKRPQKRAKTPPSRSPCIRMLSSNLTTRRM